MKPDLQLEPISILSSGMVRTKKFNNIDFPLIREGEVITLSTKIINKGSKFEYHKKIPVRWYLNDAEGKAKVIAEQLYGSPDGIILNNGDEIPVFLNIETTNLRVTSLDSKYTIRNFKVALLKENFDDCFLENKPLFTDKQEANFNIVFDSWPPELRVGQLTLSNPSPLEGDSIVCGCSFHNVGKSAIHFQARSVKVEDLGADRRIILKTYYPKIEFVNSTFDKLPFDSGDSNKGLNCKSISFDFIPLKDIWVDSIKIKPKPGTAENVKCSKIKILYLGYYITSSEPKLDIKTGIQYLSNPIFLEEGKKYHFEFEGVTGTPMVGDEDYRISSHDIIKNSVITINDNSSVRMHPKIKLLFLNTLPPQSEGRLEMIWETDRRVETKFLQWTYHIAAENYDIFKTIPVEVKIPEIKGFKLTSENSAKIMGKTRIVEFQIEITKESDVKSLSVNITPVPPFKNKNKFKVYLRRFDQISSTPVNKLTLNLQDAKPKLFIAGIAASEDVPACTTSIFTINAKATVHGQKIEKNMHLEFALTPDYSEVIKEYNFSVKPNWRILSIVPGNRDFVKVTVKNIGRKPDVIKLGIAHLLPVGWYARPSHRRLSVKPGEAKSTKFTITVPSSATIGVSGDIVIKATSKKNPVLSQIKPVTIRAS